MAAIARWLPGFAVVQKYDRRWLPRDLIAGIVLTTLLVPQGMAYAELAGLPAITGLYTTVVCLVAYALVGPSRILVLGPDSALGTMIAATILPLAAGAEDQAIALAGVLAIMVGAIAGGAGLVHLGFIADLLSNPVRTGYLAGLAVIFVVDSCRSCSASPSTPRACRRAGRVRAEPRRRPCIPALAIGLLSLA